MNFIAIKMLLGDRAKCIGLIFGITFATILMSQQVCMFIGLMNRTANLIHDVSEANIWIMDPAVTYIDESRPLSNINLLKVKSVPGVDWAVPLFRAMASSRDPSGRMQSVILIGIDDASLIARPANVLLGNIRDLYKPDAIALDKAGYNFIWPGEPLRLGRILEINDKRITVAVICQASAPFSTSPIAYARFDLAKQLVPSSRNTITYIIAKAQNNLNPSSVAQNIQQQTSLKALSSTDFAWQTILYYLKRTGIPINFGITITLGFVLGTAIAGQTFYLFVTDNLNQFAALKAIGVTNLQIFKMVILQASYIAFVGFGIGIGIVSLYFKLTTNINALRGFHLYWQVMLATATAVILIMSTTSLISLRKVLKVDPALIFRL